MSYDGTVRCRFCRETGHNRRTCLKYAQRAKENPNSLIAERYKNMKERDIVKSCSYCQMTIGSVYKAELNRNLAAGQGHNIATCEQYKKDKIDAVFKNATFRKEIYEKMKSYGLGIGAMLSLNEKYGLMNRKMFFIHSIVWDKIIFRNSGQNVECTDLSFQRDLSLDFVLKSSFFQRIDNKQVVVEIPCDPQFFGAGMPKNWLNGVSGIEDYFTY